MTYLALLLAIAAVSAVLAASATVWSQAQRRERETQLLWAGDQFRRALLAYAQAGNGVYPQRLEDLLEDPRSPARRRFLRRLYGDPMTRGDDWALLRDERGGIVGVHSRSTAVPVKTGGFPAEYVRFAGARTYAEWTFSAAGAAPAPTAPPSPAPAPQPPARSSSAPAPAAPAPLAPAASSPSAAEDAAAPPPADEPEREAEPPPVDND